MRLDERFFPHGDEFRGRRVHQVRLQGGDASSDSSLPLAREAESPVAVPGWCRQAPGGYGDDWSRRARWTAYAAIVRVVDSVASGVSSRSL